MKAKLLFLVFLTPFIFYSQTQIGADIDGEAEYDESGESISLSSDGSIVAIGAPRNDGNGNTSGHVRVYENLSGVWTQIGQDIDGEAEEDYSGESVSLSSDGSIVAIGAIYNNGNGWSSGQVRVFKNNLGVWTQIGQDIDGEAANDYSGCCVSLSSNGTIVAIGARNNDGNGENSGHVRVYQNIAGVWTQIGQDIDGEAASDYSGYSVDLSSDGTIVAIGARSNNGNGTEAGHVRVYEYITNTWSQIGQDIDGEAADDRLGSNNGVSLSSDGSILAVGADNNSGNGIESGHVRIYKNIASVWTQIGEDIDGEAVEDNSGNGVRLSSNGSIVAIGANANNGNGEDSGHVRVYTLSALLSVQDNYVTDNFSVIPNHSSTVFQVKLNEVLDVKNITLYNYLGQKVIQTKETTLNISNLSKGLYYLQVETNTSRGVKKVLVE